MEVLKLSTFLSVLSIVFAHNNISHSHTGEGDLKLVLVLFRHGDRNPIDPFPNFSHKNESFWPEGWGQLTKAGKMQHYKLGQYLRHRYEDFLSDTYSPYEILVKSSSVDRTIMSAEADLAGLYPPNPNDDFSVWNPNLLWQPIPVHAQPPDDDKLLHLNGICPRYDEIRDDFLNNSPEIKKLHEEYGYIFELLTNKTGRSVKTPEDVDYAYDLIFIQNKYYPGWPEWADEKVLAAMRYITTFSFKSLTFTPEMQRLKGGPLLKDWVTNLNDKKSGKMDKRRKFLMYSGHDTTVAVLLNTMRVFDPPQIPPYCSLVILELRQQESVNLSSDNGTYHVKILFKNHTDQEAHVLQVPNCGSPCTLEDFNELMKSNIPGDMGGECRRSDGYRLLDSVGFSVGILAFGSIAVFLLVVASVFYGMIRYRKSSSKPPAYPYLHLQMEDEEA